MFHPPRVKTEELNPIQEMYPPMIRNYQNMNDMELVEAYQIATLKLTVKNTPELLDQTTALKTEILSRMNG